MFELLGWFGPRKGGRWGDSLGMAFFLLRGLCCNCTFNLAGPNFLGRLFFFFGGDAQEHMDFLKGDFEGF